MLVLVSLSSCRKFLEIKPKNIFIPTTLTDYENMLNAATVNLLGDYAVDLQTDDAFLPNDAPGNQRYTLFNRIFLGKVIMTCCGARVINVFSISIR